MRTSSLRKTGLLGIAIVCAVSAGCQSVPRWNWWQIGQKAPTDSSAIARSAEIELPSVIASKNSSDGDVAPPFVPDSPGSAFIASTATPVQYPSTGYDSPAIPSTESNAPSAGIQNANALARGNIRPYGEAIDDPVGDPTAPQTTPYNVASTPHAGAIPDPVAQSAAASSSLANSQPDRYGESSTGRYGDSTSAPPVGAPAPVQLSAVDTTTPNDRYAESPNTPDRQSAISAPASQYPAEVPDRYATQAPTNVLRESSAPVTAPDPPRYANAVAATTPTQTPINTTAAPYRPGGTSDYTGAAQAAYSLATRPDDSARTSAQTPPSPANDGRYAAPPYNPAPTNYR